jgi:L-fuconolactonase
LTEGVAYNRRRFVTATVKAVAGISLAGSVPCVRAGQKYATTDAGGFTLIDAHTHFYDPTRPQGVPWPPRDLKLLYRTVLPRDYRALPPVQAVMGTIVVEASPWLEDNQWVLDLAAHDPLIVGFVGNLPIGTKPFAGQLERFASNRLFRGIRLRGRKLDGLLDDQAFVSDLKLLADHDLSLDLVGGREIIPFADRLAKEVPGLRIIIDHLAGVVVDGKAPPADWVQGMEALVLRRNIYCKVSGLVEGTGRNTGTAPGDMEFYRPVLDKMLEMFGPERLIYASNWPVCEMYAPLATVQGIVVEYLRGHGRQVEEQIFSQSAKAAYRWIHREKPEE